MMTRWMRGGNYSVRRWTRMDAFVLDTSRQLRKIMPIYRRLFGLAMQVVRDGE